MDDKAAHMMLAGSLGFGLCLEASGYEYPEERCGPDADWLSGSVVLYFGSPDMDPLRVGVSWRTEELRAFADELGQLLSQEISRATFTHLEEQVEIELLINDDRVTCGGVISLNFHVKVCFEGVEVTFDALREAHQGLERLIARFPVRSSLSA